MNTNLTHPYLQAYHVAKELANYIPNEKSHQEFLVALPIGIISGALYPTPCYNKKFDIFALATIVSSFVLVGASIYHFEKEKEGLNQAKGILKCQNHFHILSNEEVSKLKMLTPEIIWQKLQPFSVCPDEILVDVRREVEQLPKNLLTSIERKSDDSLELFERCSRFVTKKWTVKYLNEQLTEENVKEMHAFALKNDLKLVLR